MYVCMYVCIPIYVRTYVALYICIYVCYIYVCMHACNIWGYRALPFFDDLIYIHKCSFSSDSHTHIKIMQS